MQEENVKKGKKNREKQKLLFMLTLTIAASRCDHFPLQNIGVAHKYIQPLLIN